MKWALSAWVMVVALMTSCAAQAQFSLDEDCNPLPAACEPVRDCTQELTDVSTRDCRACLVRNPFGGCLTTGLDPICEAQKAATRAAAEAERAARKADCERLKATEVASCRAEMELRVLECKASKNQQESDPQATIIDLLSAAVDRNTVDLPYDLIPPGILEEFTGGIASGANKIEVVEIEPGDYVPRYASQDDFGFTVGNFVFVKDFNLISDQGVEFWLSQIETSRLYSDYGVEEFSTAYEDDPEPFKNLISAKVRRFCAENRC